MKILGLLILGIAAFAGTLLVALGATGNLNAATLDRLLGKEPEQAAQPVDDIGPLARQLKEERDKLKARVATVEKEEKRLELLRRDIEEQRDEVERLLAEVQKSMDERDEETMKRIEETAKTVAAMEAENAAEALKLWPPEDAALVLLKMKDKERGAILDALDGDDADTASEFLRADRDLEE